MKVIDPDRYDVDGIHYAACVIADALHGRTIELEKIVSDQFTGGASELIRLVADVMEEAWTGRQNGAIFFLSINNVSGTAELNETLENGQWWAVISSY